MAVTVHRYEFDELYIIENLGDRFRVDIHAADKFHKETVDLRYGLENLLARFFSEDAKGYGILVEAAPSVMEKLGTEASDFDFIKDYCNGENRMDLFYSAASIYKTLQKVKANESFLVEKKFAREPENLEKLDGCISFLEKAMQQNNLIHFWDQ
jgi:hypothetical protein